MEERRRFVRLDTRLEVEYTVLPTGSPRVTVSKDIGGGGICLFADRVLPVGTKLQIAMRLPGRDQPAQFTGEVMWSEPYEVIGRAQRETGVEVGVQFVDISPQDREAILQHVILSMKPPHPGP